MERAMKVQEVILQAMAKKITWFQAAEIIGISDRHMRRWRERYEEGGFRGLFDRGEANLRRRGCAWRCWSQCWSSIGRSISILICGHFYEKLASEHQIGLSCSWVKDVLQGAGLFPMISEKGFLLRQWDLHEHIVANEIRLFQRQTRRIEALEDFVWVFPCDRDHNE
jgi:hypothetical protein